ncbi:hypothetical protein GCM10027345_42810 [Hymenobacter daeguensis]
MCALANEPQRGDMSVASAPIENQSPSGATLVQQVPPRWGSNAITPLFTTDMSPRWGLSASGPGGPSAYLRPARGSPRPAFAPKKANPRLLA